MKSATITLSAIALGTVGCSNDLDDLFCDPHCEEVAADEPSDSDAPAAGSDAGTEPAEHKEDTAQDIPFPDGLPQGCEACAVEACVAEKDACLADPECAAGLLAGADFCADPNCADREAGETAQDELSWFDPLSHELWACVFRECPGPCQSGANWECLDNFAWQNPDAATIDVYARFGVGRDWGNGSSNGNRIDFAGVTARVDGDGPAQPLDAANGVTLRLPTSNGPFRGFVELQGDDVGPVPLRYRVYLPPIATSQYLWVDVQPDMWLVGGHGWLPSPDTAALWTFLSDCMSAGAIRAHFELVEYPDVEVWHAAGDLDPSATESTWGAAFFPAIPVKDDDETVTVRAMVDGQVVSQRKIDLRTGWRTVVNLVPRSVTGE